MSEVVPSLHYIVRPLYSHTVIYSIDHLNLTHALKSPSAIHFSLDASLFVSLVCSRNHAT